MVLLDSNVLIYASTPAGRFLTHWINSPTAFVSGISIPEVLGYTKLDVDDRLMFEQCFREIRVLDVSAAILWDAAALRRQRRMSLGDSVIGATALHHGLDLVTRNVADFEHLPGLRIINPFN